MMKHIRVGQNTLAHQTEQINLVETRHQVWLQLKNWILLPKIKMLYYSCNDIALKKNLTFVRSDVSVISRNTKSYLHLCQSEERIRHSIRTRPLSAYGQTRYNPPAISTTDLNTLGWALGLTLPYLLMRLLVYRPRRLLLRIKYES